MEQIVAYLCALALIIIIIVLSSFAAEGMTNAYVNSREEPWVLVGTGCEGPSTVAVATAEDLLPRCEVIEVHTVATP